MMPRNDRYQTQRKDLSIQIRTQYTTFLLLFLLPSIRRKQEEISMKPPYNLKPHRARKVKGAQTCWRGGKEKGKRKNKYSEMKWRPNRTK